jgi:hypothetical protein
MSKSASKVSILLSFKLFFTPFLLLAGASDVVQSIRLGPARRFRGDSRRVSGWATQVCAPPGLATKTTHRSVKRTNPSLVSLVTARTGIKRCPADPVPCEFCQLRCCCPGFSLCVVPCTRGPECRPPCFESTIRRAHVRQQMPAFFMMISNLLYAHDTQSNHQGANSSYQTLWPRTDIFIVCLR